MAKSRCIRFTLLHLPAEGAEARKAPGTSVQHQATKTRGTKRTTQGTKRITQGTAPLPPLRYGVLASWPAQRAAAPTSLLCCSSGGRMEGRGGKDRQSGGLTVTGTDSNSPPYIEGDTLITGVKPEMQNKFRHPIPGKNRPRSPRAQPVARLAFGVRTFPTGRYRLRLLVVGKE